MSTHPSATHQNPVVFLNTTSFLTLQNYAIRLQRGAMNFAWLSEQTAIISLYGIKLMGFQNPQQQCLLCGTK
jgi:hypothetical protein